MLSRGSARVCRYSSLYSASADLLAGADETAIPERTGPAALLSGGPPYQPPRCVDELASCCAESRRCRAPRTVVASQRYMQTARLCCRGCSLRACMESSQPSALQFRQFGASSSRAGRGLAAARWGDAGDLADKRWSDAMMEFLVDYDLSYALQP